MKQFRSLYIIAQLCVILSLQSCFVARNYQRPESVAEAARFRTDQLHQDSLSLAGISWRDMFTDPRLQELIAEGLRNNMDIRVAIQQILIADAYLKQGKAGYIPTLEARARYTRQELSSNSQFGRQFSTLDQYELSGGLSWEADIWGKIRSSKRALQATYLQSAAAHQAVKSRLVANVASLYYQLLSLDEQIRITSETVDTRQYSIETTVALKDAGNLTEVAVKQTEAQLYSAQALLIDLKRDVQLLENTLSVLLGSPARDILRGQLAEQEVASELKVGVPSQLLSNRPDVMASEFNLIQTFELTNVAKSAFYPSFTITASSGLQSLAFGELFSGSSVFATLGGGLLQPILNGRRIRTQYEVSLAEQEKAALDFQNALLVAGREVSDALYSYEAATDKIAVKEKEFEAYSLATTYSEQLLENGFANYLEVLRARENALNSSLDIVQVQNSRLQAVVDLYEALGGGWQ